MCIKFHQNTTTRTRYQNGQSKIERMFEILLVGEKGVSVIVQFNWSFMFLNPFVEFTLGFANVLFVIIITRNGVYRKFNKITPTIPITHRPISLPINIHNKLFFNDRLTKLGILIIQTTSLILKISPTSINVLTPKPLLTQAYTPFYVIIVKNITLAKPNVNLTKAFTNINSQLN